MSYASLFHNVTVACTVADMKKFLNSFPDDTKVGTIHPDGGFDSSVSMSLVFVDKFNKLQPTESSDTVRRLEFS